MLTCWRADFPTINLFYRDKLDIYMGNQPWLSRMPYDERRWREVGSVDTKTERVSSTPRAIAIMAQIAGQFCFVFVFVWAVKISCILTASLFIYERQSSKTRALTFVSTRCVLPLEVHTRTGSSFWITLCSKTRSTLFSAKDGGAARLTHERRQHTPAVVLLRPSSWRRRNLFAASLCF